MRHYTSAIGARQGATGRLLRWWGSLACPCGEGVARPVSWRDRGVGQGAASGYEVTRLEASLPENVPQVEAGLYALALGGTL